MTPTLLTLSVVFGAPGLKDPPTRDPPSLVGEWVVQTETSRGRTHRPAQRKDALVYNFSADGELVVRHGPTWSRCRFTADAKKNPCEVDWWSARKSTVRRLGIYKIEKDVLTVCFVSFGGDADDNAGPVDRPTTFDGPEGSVARLVVLERKKKE